MWVVGYSVTAEGGKDAGSSHASALAILGSALEVPELLLLDALSADGSVRGPELPEYIAGIVPR